MLSRVIGEDTDLIFTLSPQPCQVKADPGQLELVVMNLAVNGRDAMPKGGKLTIETASVELSNEYVDEYAEVRAGPYTMLAVTDGGSGMDAETLAHIFEPFFTTKEEGKSTGLGLATVYGIVKQSGGHIRVYSELGKGTTFKVYLPLVGQNSEKEEPKPAAMEFPTGSETVLLVEDEDGVRKLTSFLLKRAGYSLLEALQWGRGYGDCIAPTRGRHRFAHYGCGDAPDGRAGAGRRHAFVLSTHEGPLSERLHRRRHRTARHPRR